MTMQRAEIYEKLTAVFQEVFQRADIVVTPDLTADAVAGWNSFKNVEIILGVEECFGIRLGSRDVDGLENVGDLAAVIAAKLQTLR
jgi:acyl carrier protein